MNIRNDNNTQHPNGPLLFECVVGSQAYGLATKDSDVDTIGIWVAPYEDIIGLHPLSDKGSTRVHQTSDRVYHEIGKFMRLALNCNPTLLECLYIKDPDLVIHTTPEWQELQRMAFRFLGRKRIEDAYLGYAVAQAKRLKDRPDHPRYKKHVRHCFRLLFQGKELLETSHLRVHLPDEQIQTIRLIEAMPPESMLQAFEKYAQEIRDFSAQIAQYDYRSVPKDLVHSMWGTTSHTTETLNNWLLDTRLKYWGLHHDE